MKLWSLYWRDRHLKFHIYDRVPPSASIEVLLAEVDLDPPAICWGWGRSGAVSHGLAGEQVCRTGPLKGLAGPVVDLLGDRCQVRQAQIASPFST